jgi:hypothetical protein
VLHRASSRCVFDLPFLSWQEAAGDIAATKARREACNDVLNFISHAAHCHYLFGEGTLHPINVCNVYSLDEFAVHLGKVPPPKHNKGVMTTAEAQKTLKKGKKALKNPSRKDFQAKDTYSKIVINLAINPAGRILAAVYCIREGDYKLDKRDNGVEWQEKQTHMEVPAVSLSLSLSLSYPHSHYSYTNFIYRTTSCPRGTFSLSFYLNR